MKDLSGIFSSQLAESGQGKRQSVAVLPIGKFNTAKYGELEITAEQAQEIVANWTNRVLKTDIRFDIGHDMEEAAGWIVGLSVGTFEHPVSGKTLPGIIAEVEWTPVGQKLLGEKQYRYVSSYLSDYKDEETGTVYHNVLVAVALCNDPIMRMLPPVELSDAPDGEPYVLVALGEVVDEMTREETVEDSQEALWDAFGAIQRLLQKEVRENGLSGAELVARVAELTADLPNAVAVAIASEAAESGAMPDTNLADGGAKDPVAEILAGYDALMAKADDIVKGASGVRSMRTLAAETRAKLVKLLEGGTKKMSDTTTPEAIELAALKRTIRNGKITDALQKLSDKGMAEPARNALEAILTSETPDAIVLSEGAEPVEIADAVMAFADAVEFVPVETPDSGGELPNDNETVTLTAEEAAVAKQLGTDPEAVKAAKTMKED